MQRIMFVTLMHFVEIQKAKITIQNNKMKEINRPFSLSFVYALLCPPLHEIKWKEMNLNRRKSLK